MVEVSKDRTRLTVNAVFEDGVPLCTDQAFLCDTRLLNSGSESFRVVEIRFAVPSRLSEDVYLALRKGDVELLVQDIPRE